MSQENSNNSEAASSSVDPFDIWRGHLITPFQSDTRSTNQYLDFMQTYFPPDSDGANTTIVNAFEDYEDDDDYEEPEQLMEWEIEELPTHKCTEEEAKDEMCVICIVDFEKDEVLRMLPCKHMFHTECIDRWLAISSKCPVCRMDALDY